MKHKRREMYLQEYYQRTKEKRKENYLKNREQILQKAKENYKNNPEKYRQRSLNATKKDLEKYNKYQLEYRRKKKVEKFVELEKKIPIKRWIKIVFNTIKIPALTIEDIMNPEKKYEKYKESRLKAVRKYREKRKEEKLLNLPKDLSKEERAIAVAQSILRKKEEKAILLKLNKKLPSNEPPPISKEDNDKIESFLKSLSNEK